MRTHSLSSQQDKFTVSSEPRFKLQLDMLLLKLYLSQNTTMLDNTTVIAFTKSETKLHAVHAGLSVPLKLFQIDSVLLERMSFSPQKTWLNATTPSLDAKEDG